MTVKMYLVILALLHAGIAVNAFQITAYEPRTNANSGVKLDEGTECQNDPQEGDALTVPNYSLGMNV